MVSFRYKALQKDGTISEGSLEVGSRGEATRRLNEQGMQVINLTEEKGKKKAAAAKTDPSKPVRKPTTAPVENRLSSKQLVQFTEELSDLLSAGVQLDTALNSIAKRSESSVISQVAGSCYDKVRDGVPLATALRVSSSSFNELYCNLVSAGEVSGALGDILKRQVRYLNTLAELKGKLATALIYPSFLVVSGVGVSAMFVFFLIPKLRRLVESTGGTLPPIAKVMLASGDFVKANWIALLVVFIVAIIVLVVLFQRETVKRWWDEKKLKIPLLGKLLLTRFNVQFVETLSNLLTNGLPLVRALELVGRKVTTAPLLKLVAPLAPQLTHLAVRQVASSRPASQLALLARGPIDARSLAEHAGIEMPQLSTLLSLPQLQAVLHCSLRGPEQPADARKSSTPRQAATSVTLQWVSKLTGWISRGGRT
jgi:general secretion pathway protein F/type IV pilus assembly protein PilC